MQDEAFRLTYSTMFDPPQELHRRFEEALGLVKGRLGSLHPMRIGGEARLGKDEFECRSPIDREWLLARFPRGTAQDASDAVAAARAAFRPWAATPWTERVALLRGVAGRIEERVYELGAAMALEVGKNRMESLGEVQETADLIRWYCDEMEENGGEWVTDRLGAQGTVAGGGRYDGLFEQLGGTPTPACGFALGAGRLILLLQGSGTAARATPLVYIVHAGEAAAGLAGRPAELLRDAGHAVVLNAGGGSFKAQMKRADASGARLALLIGADEAANDAVSVKPLREPGEQRTVPLAALVATLAAR